MMSRLVVLHEAQVVVRVADDLPESMVVVIRRLLLSRAFRDRLAKVAREMIAQELASPVIQVRVSH